MAAVCLAALCLAPTALKEVHAQPPVRKIAKIVHQGEDFVLVSSDDSNAAPVELHVCFTEMGQGMRGGLRNIVTFQHVGEESDLDDDDLVEAALARPDRFNRMRNHQTADEFVFGSATAAIEEQRICKLLAEKVTSVDRICTLTDLQKRKIELAGRGDVTHLRHQTERVKMKFARCNERWTVEEIKEWATELSAERERLRVLYLSCNVFGEGTLFVKVVRSVLTPEQLEMLERRLFNPVAPKPAQGMGIQGNGFF